MTPPLPRRSFPLLAAASLALTLLAGCGKPSDDEDTVPPDRQAAATPSPAAVAANSERTGRRTLSAYNAVSEYLKDQDPDLREHLQKAAAKFVKDKDKWRDRLAGRQRDLQPRIARLRDQLTKAGGQTSGALRSVQQELSSLEIQRADADRKLSELESVTSDTWKSFRDQLTAEADEAPSPAPAKR